MKTLDVLTKAEVMDAYSLSAHFLRKHGREMGGVGRPMLFAREHVEAFLRTYLRPTAGAAGKSIPDTDVSVTGISGGPYVTGTILGVGRMAP